MCEHFEFEEKNQFIEVFTIELRGLVPYQSLDPKSGVRGRVQDKTNYGSGILKVIR